MVVEEAIDVEARADISEFALLGHSELRERIVRDHFFDSAHYLVSLRARGLSLPEGVDLLDHYLSIGRQAGATPSMRFDPKYYLFRYPDVAKSGEDSVSHFLAHGTSRMRWGAHPMSLPRRAAFNSSWGRPIAPRRNSLAGTFDLVRVQGDASSHGARDTEPRRREFDTTLSVAQVAAHLKDSASEFLMVAKSAVRRSTVKRLVRMAVEWDVAIVAPQVSEGDGVFYSGMEVMRDGVLLWSPPASHAHVGLSPVTIPSGELSCINVADARAVGGIDEGFTSWEYALADLALRLGEARRSIAVMAELSVEPDLPDIVKRYPVAWRGFNGGDPARLVEKHRQRLEGVPTLAEAQRVGAVNVTAFLITSDGNSEAVLAAEIRQAAQANVGMLLISLTETIPSVLAEIATQLCLPLSWAVRHDGRLSVSGVPNYVLIKDLVGSDSETVEIAAQLSLPSGGRPYVTRILGGERESRILAAKGREGEPSQSPSSSQQMHLGSYGHAPADSVRRAI